ncbi:hypothetical protein BSK71_00325 [Pectobacterium actinidiae]|uniref:Uncharacterized protein n=1 Tax=Pectobacterium actinidiae TaxID=1507808 RepID=A0A1V2R8K7_9GAMM|nr:hypothetical protein BSK69_02545 [Pectobacterium actinidiae]ONK08714.1 hypothetical protein BSK71_00325 [Pectobacterium actinidiae]
MLFPSLLYPSYFKLLVRWPPLLTPVTYLSKLLGIRAVASFTQLELFRVYISNSGNFLISQATSMLDIRGNTVMRFPQGYLAPW